MKWIEANWPISEQVAALTTTRIGGVSLAPYDSMNVGGHVGDLPESVERNRVVLTQQLGLPQPPLWLNQIHGSNAIHALPPYAYPPMADAAWSQDRGTVLAIMTADCLPVLLADPVSGWIGAAHCGWRSLASGVLANLVTHYPYQAKQLYAWLGPCIGPEKFEVGAEVRSAFIERFGQPAQAAFSETPHGKWLADLRMLARIALELLGVTQVYTDHHCTYSDKALFHSYRRDGISGRMATLLWMRRPDR